VNRIHVVKMVCEGGKRRMFSLASDLEMLRRKINSIGDIKVVLIDPVSAYLGVGKVESYRTTDVRAVLGPLTDLAMELKVAIIGIMHFNKKTDVTNALLRISDSLAFGATARSVYGVVSDPDNQRQLIVRAKNNLAERSAKALAFESRDVGAVNGRVIRAPFIVTATEAMQAANERKSPGARDAAKQFLLGMLADGKPVDKAEIEEAADANCISVRTLRRAKQGMKNVTTVWLKDRWAWQLVHQREA
jgi:hypothetical protein